MKVWERNSKRRILLVSYFPELTLTVEKDGLGGGRGYLPGKVAPKAGAGQMGARQAASGRQIRQVQADQRQRHPTCSSVAGRRKRVGASTLHLR